MDFVKYFYDLHTYLFEHIIADGEPEQPVEQLDKTDDVKPLISKDSLGSSNHMEIKSISRSYSPIIEDPRERDSRPASVDPSDRSNIKQDDTMSLSSRAMTSSSMSMSRSASPAAGPSKEILPASDPTRRTSLTVKTLNEIGSEPKNETIQLNETNEMNASENTKENEERLQPIFKPLITEKGKSKTTGKSIGGWI